MSRYIRLHRTKMHCQLTEEFQDIQKEIMDVIDPHLKRIHPRDLLASEAVFYHAVSQCMTMERLRRFAMLEKSKAKRMSVPRSMNPVQNP
jgi:hypothetical protein